MLLSPEITSARPTIRLPRTAAFVGTAAAFFLLFFAAGAPTPLYVVFEQQWGFPAWLLTVAFAAYAFGLIAAVLVAGSLSDHIGRRPVLIGALAVETVSMAMFVFAPNIGWIIAARIVQGIATGAASSSFTAMLIELAPERRKTLGAILGGAAPTAGLALGALLAGFTVQFSNGPAAAIFAVLAIAMVLAIVLVALSPETNPGRPGAVRSLVPRASIPPLARAEFFANVPVQVGAWMLAALFLGLAPSIIRDVFGVHSSLVNGFAGFLEPAVAAVAGLVVGRLTARNTTLLGGVAVVTGIAIILASVATGWFPLLFVGGAIGGFGFGASFSGGLRILAPLVHIGQRSELFSGVFLVAYLAFGVPALVAGQFIASAGLFTVTIVYGAATLVVAAVGLAAQLRMRPVAPSA
jgi:MFS family permease